MAQLKETLKWHRLPALISSPSNVFENALVNAVLFGGLDPQARETPPRKIKTTGEIEDHVHDLSRNTTAAKKLKNRLPNGLNPNPLICLDFHGKTATALSPLANRISDSGTAHIQSQPEHHRRKSFKKEFREFFEKVISTTTKNTSGIDLNTQTQSPRGHSSPTKSAPPTPGCSRFGVPEHERTPQSSPRPD